MKKHHVLRSAGLVSGFTMLSRVLGLARDVCMAGFFGTGWAASAFLYAFAIPNLFRRLFGEGALSAAFVPVFIQVREVEGKDAAWLLARKLVTLVGTFLVLVVIVSIGVVTLAMMHHGVSEEIRLLLNLLRIMLPYLVFICLAALSMAMLNSYRHFAVPAATPCLLNIIWIIAVIYVSPHFGETLEERVHGVAWGVLFAGVVQLAAQLPMLFKHGFKPGWNLDLKDPGLRRVLVLALPAALGAAVTQVNVLVDRTLAIWVGDYAVAALFYSERLIYLPLGIFATALGTVLLPVYSQHAAADQQEEILATMNHALRNLMFVVVPAALGLLFLAAPIIQMIFQWREFDATSTWYTAVALQFYAPGLVIFSLAKMFVPAFYARQDTRTPVKIGAGCVGLNILLSLVFVFTWPANLKHAGLVCATVISEALYVTILAAVLHRRYGSPGWGSVGRAGLRFLAIGAVMGMVALQVQQALLGVLTDAGWLAKAAQIGSVLMAIAAGGACYFLLAALFRFREVRELKAAVLKR